MVSQDICWFEENVFSVLPKQWWEDFVALVEGGKTSKEFDKYFEKSAICQNVFERTLRYLDRELIQILREENECEMESGGDGRNLAWDWSCFGVW